MGQSELDIYGKENNHAIYTSLSKYWDLDVTRIGMWYDSSPLAKPPVFRFCMKKYAKDWLGYEMLKVIVNSFKGNVEWDLLTGETRNYFIVPKVFIEYLFDREYPFTREYISTNMGSEVYERNVKNAIIDTPRLAQEIENSFRHE